MVWGIVPFKTTDLVIKKGDIIRIQFPKVRVRLNRELAVFA
jgi:hypothetical protein